MEHKSHQYSDSPIEDLALFYSKIKNLKGKQLQSLPSQQMLHYSYNVSESPLQQTKRSPMSPITQNEHFEASVITKLKVHPSDHTMSPDDEKRLSKVRYQSVPSRVPLYEKFHKRKDIGSMRIRKMLAKHRLQIKEKEPYSATMPQFLHSEPQQPQQQEVERSDKAETEESDQLFEMITPPQKVARKSYFETSGRTRFSGVFSGRDSKREDGRHCMTCRKQEVLESGKFDEILAKAFSPESLRASAMATTSHHRKWHSTASEQTQEPVQSPFLKMQKMGVNVDYHKRAQQLMTIEEIKRNLVDSKMMLKEMKEKEQLPIYQPPFIAPLRQSQQPVSLSMHQRASSVQVPVRRTSVNRISEGADLNEAFKSFVNFQKAQMPPVQYKFDYFPDRLKQKPEFKRIYEQNIWEMELKEICEKPPKERTKYDKLALAHWISQVPMIESYAQHIIQEICSRIGVREFKGGEQIMDCDDPNGPLYIVYEGKLRIEMLGQPDSASQLLANRKPLLIPRDTFGCHIYDRDFTNLKYFFIPLSSCTCFTLSNADYKAIILSQKKIEAVSFLNFIKSVTFFKEWEMKRLQNFCGGLYLKKYNRGDVVYQEGFPPDNFYIVKQGRFRVEKFVNLDTENVWPKKVREWEVSKVKRTLCHTIDYLEKGRFVGQREILYRLEREVTITADTDNCFMLVMNRDVFWKMLGPSDQQQIVSLDINKFPSQQELEMKLTVQNKLKKLKNTAVLNAANTNYHPLGARDFYIEKERKKLIPWLQGYEERMRRAKEKFRVSNKIEENSFMTQLNNDDYQKAIKVKNAEIAKIYTGIAELIIKQSTSAIQ